MYPNKKLCAILCSPQETYTTEVYDVPGMLQLAQAVVIKLIPFSQFQSGKMRIIQAAIYLVTGLNWFTTVWFWSEIMRILG